MPKTETVYARLILKPYSSRFDLVDREYESHPRLFEVLTEEFYMNPFTQELIRLNPEVFAARIAYQENPSTLTRNEIKEIQAVGKFEVQDQKVELHNLHVRFSRYAKFPKVDGYLDTWYLERLRERIFVEMPDVRHTTREEHIVNVEFDQNEQRLLYGARWNFYEDQPLKDAGEMMRLMRKSANTHWSRYAAVKAICKDTPRVIIFYNHNYELEILRCLHTDLDIPLAEWNGHVHQDIPDSDTWVYLVQYQAGSEGWNCTSTDTVIFYSLPYSYRNFAQAKGRIDRMNTKYEVLHYYIFRSRAIIDQAIWKALTRKKNFQASAFATKTWPKMESITRLN